MSEQYIKINNITSDFKHVYIDLDGCLIRMDIPSDIATREDLITFLKDRAEEIRAQWEIADSTPPETPDVTDLIGTEIP